ncbi:hypothetical protein HY990_01245 [Candidatus Micrarchaeota archaeon]|nr:hypothetical protein [Candidatus Micrarchaeota archaeon]
MDNRKAKLIKASAKYSASALINFAISAYSENQNDRSRRYVKMALDTIKKNRVRLSAEDKNKLCKKCSTVWVPNKTVSLSFDQKNNLFRAMCKCGFSKAI